MESKELYENQYRRRKVQDNFDHESAANEERKKKLDRHSASRAKTTTQDGGNRRPDPDKELQGRVATYYTERKTAHDNIYTMMEDYEQITKDRVNEYGEQVERQARINEETKSHAPDFTDIAQRLMQHGIAMPVAIYPHFQQAMQEACANDDALKAIMRKYALEHYTNNSWMKAYVFDNTKTTEYLGIIWRFYNP